MQSDPQRRARGAQKIGEILGQTPDQVERSLGDLAPQLVTYVIETIYGEIYQSPALDARTRQIVTVAALATLASAAPQLRPTSATPCRRAILQARKHSGAICAPSSEINSLPMPPRSRRRCSCCTVNST